MRVVIFTLIGIVAFIGAIAFINKNDKENRIDVKNKGLISFLIALSTTLLYIKYNESLDFYIYFYLSIYLIITGYIDYKTKNVYTIFNNISIIIGVLYIIYKMKIGINMEINITYMFIYIIFVKLMEMSKSFASGDTDIFIVSSLFIINLNTFPLIFLLINMVLSNMLAILTNLKLVDIKKFRFKEEIAFAPSIALSTMILVLV